MSCHQVLSLEPASPSSSGGSWFDELNRMTGDPTYTYSHGTLGNRTGRTTRSNSAVITYGWDELNRLKSFAVPSTTSYYYRADGMRTRTKSPTALNTFYCYDGQMGFQDYARNGSTLQNTNWVVNYGLGARGVDFIENLNSSLAVTSTKFPLYDAHGNMVATLARNGTGCTLADSRSYDAWGVIRTGNTTGDPRGKYCANLGHKVDDENGLVYMRARYYEPTRGRFISEDTARSGANYFCYAANDSANYADSSGRNPILMIFNCLLADAGFYCGFSLAALPC